MKLSEKEILLLRQKNEFSSRLKSCLHDKEMANNLIDDVHCYVRESLKERVSDTHWLAFP